MAEQPAAALATFVETGDPAALVRAADLLEQIDPRVADDFVGRRELRCCALDGWISMLNIIDERLDAGFDPGDVPEIATQPPPSGTVQLPPGADPAALADPAARKAYENTIQKNQREIEAYNLQHLVRRLEERASRAVKRLVQESYLPVPHDQQELGSARQALVNPERRSLLTCATDS